MKQRRLTALCINLTLPLMLCAAAGPASAKSEIKGAAILDHPCGKVSVKQMGLAHAGKMEEANKLTTKEMQEQWKAMPAKDRTMMSGMMKEMSQTEEQYSADIKSAGVLVVDGPTATLTQRKRPKTRTVPVHRRRLRTSRSTGANAWSAGRTLTGRGSRPPSVSGERRGRFPIGPGC